MKEKIKKEMKKRIVENSEDVLTLHDPIIYLKWKTLFMLTKSKELGSIKRKEKIYNFLWYI